MSSTRNVANDTECNAPAEGTNNTIFQMAVETLLTLNDYSKVLENLSIEASDHLGQAEFQERFLKLIEGIETFTESIVQIKAALNIGICDTLIALESDLSSILKDLLESQEKGNLDYEKNLLKTRLPANLIQWRTTGIPSIQHTRDC